MIGDRLKKYRLEKGLSISQLSSKTGIAKSYISMLEKEAACNPSVQIIVHLADALSIPVHYLLSDEETNLVDSDWIKLVQKAIELGVTKEQFEEYLFLKHTFHDKQS